MHFTDDLANMDTIASPTVDEQRIIIINNRDNNPSHTVSGDRNYYKELWIHAWTS
jgi:hypothetical protein